MIAYLSNLSNRSLLKYLLGKNPCLKTLFLTSLLWA